MSSQPKAWQAIQYTPATITESSTGTSTGKSSKSQDILRDCSTACSSWASVIGWPRCSALSWMALRQVHPRHDELPDQKRERRPQQQRDEPRGLLRDRGERAHRRNEDPDEPPEGGVGARSGRFARGDGVRHGVPGGVSEERGVVWNAASNRSPRGSIAGGAMSGMPSILTPFQSRMSAIELWYAATALR